MELHIGTSGFAYKEWVGPFYPRELREKEMLGFYAAQFDTVEVNSTFYRFPSAAGLAAWASQVPDGFRFAIKAPQRITPPKRLHEISADVVHLIDTVSTLGPLLGSLLFLLPPRMPPNVEGLRDLITLFPPGLRVAFEFRDTRWHCDEVYHLLRENGCALCYNDDMMSMPVLTADWGYVRLRRDRYNEADLRATAKELLAQPWKEAYVFIKHEAPDSPLMARHWSRVAHRCAHYPVRPNAGWNPSSAHPP
jgi:uncharacterized protein YecE (DUF72 family)